MGKKRIIITETQLNELMNGKELIPFNINSIPLEELRRQYIDYSKELPISQYAYSLVTEEITSLDEASFIMRDEFSLSDWQFIIARMHNNIDCAVITPNRGDNINMVTKRMEELGYFLAATREMSREEMSWTQLQFEPLEQVPVTDEIRNIYPILYHMAPAGNIESIREKGLIPTNKNIGFNSPKRVFLMRGDVTTGAFQLLANSMHARRGGDGKYILLSIATDRIPDNVEFYNDPEHTHSIYTYSTIPPTAIINETEILSDIARRNMKVTGNNDPK